MQSTVDEIAWARPSARDLCDGPQKTLLTVPTGQFDPHFTGFGRTETRLNEVLLWTWENDEQPVLRRATPVGRVKMDQRSLTQSNILPGFVVRCSIIALPKIKWWVLHRTLPSSIEFFSPAKGHFSPKGHEPVVHAPSADSANRVIYSLRRPTLSASVRSLEVDPFRKPVTSASADRRQSRAWYLEGPQELAVRAPQQGHRRRAGAIFGIHEIFLRSGKSRRQRMCLGEEVENTYFRGLNMRCFAGVWMCLRFFVMF